MIGKGRYSGARMTIYGTILPGAVSIARWAAKVNQLTPDAKKRVKILDWHRAHGKNVSLTSRHFGIRRGTVREWQKRFDKHGILGLVERSRRPHRVRKPTTPWQIVAATVRLRKAYPRWSKYKIQTMLAKEHVTTSASTVGRIFTRKGLVDKKISRKRRKAALHPRARFPYGFKISQPGDMVQMDTKHIVLVGGRKLYQFTAIDVLTKLRVLRVYSSESSLNGTHFLEECRQQFPFPIATVQTDNGAPFLGKFDQTCKQQKIPHYFIYPRTPKQNTYVEASHHADEDEFYQTGNIVSNLPLMQQKMIERQHVWNTIRPHQALDYLTPQEYFERWQTNTIPKKKPITLQT